MSECLFYSVALCCFKRVYGYGFIFWCCPMYTYTRTHTHTPKEIPHILGKIPPKTVHWHSRPFTHSPTVRKNSRRGRAVFGMTVYLLPPPETENECYTSQLLFSHYHYSPSGTTLSVSVAAWEVHFHQHVAKRDDKLWVLPPHSYTIVKKFLSTCQPSLSSVILL